MIEDEELFAWLDGELADEQAARVAAAVAASPELTAKAAEHRQLAGSLRGAFEPVLQGTAPPSFQTGEVIDFGASATSRERRRGWFAPAQWAAMAATLALGLVVGQFIGGRSSSPVQIQDNRLVAAASLDGALNSQLASAGGGEVRIGLTFRDASGRICRSFTDSAASGLACRDRGQWRIHGLFPAAEGQAGAYRMAAGEDPRLAELLDEAIVGEPFDAAQEKAALESGWR